MVSREHTKALALPASMDPFVSDWSLLKTSHISPWKVKWPVPREMEVSGDSPAPQPRQGTGWAPPSCWALVCRSGWRSVCSLPFIHQCLKAKCCPKDANQLLYEHPLYGRKTQETFLGIKGFLIAAGMPDRAPICQVKLMLAEQGGLKVFPTTCSTLGCHAAPL